jgi:hypothetical protein
MTKLIYPVILIAAASMLVAQPLSAFAQRGHGPRDARSAPHGGARLAPYARIAPHGAAQLTPRTRIAPHGGAPRLTHPPLRTRQFAGQVYHGRLDWRHGRWRHAWRNGLYGWWWDVGGIWYYYPEQIEGPPDYISEVEAGDEEPAAPAPQSEPRYAVYYRPGDFLGARYQTLEECSQAKQQAGNVGVCIMK